MKYIIYILFFVCFGLSVKAQVPTGFPSQRWAGWIEPTYVVPDSGTIITKRDTNFIPRFVGTMVTWQHAGVDTVNWFWTGVKWNRVSAAQLDTTSLSNRINLKLNISDTAAMLSPYLRKIDTTNKWVQNVYARNDSLFKLKNGTETFVHTFPTSGSGTVTSVALSMPAAFTVSGSPITTSGTFNISGAGTSSQYIRGDGTLATMDTSAIANFYLKVRGELSGTSPINYNTTTGVISINNATSTGTKGAASFTSSFTDNGSGQIDLATLVSAGSCTGCALNIDAKGRILSYANGPAGATNNSNIGAGLRVLQDSTTQTLRTLFGAFGVVIDSVANTNGLTWRADTTRVTGLPTYYYIDSSVNSITANNGLTKTANVIQLGGLLTKSDTLDGSTSYSLQLLGSGTAAPLRINQTGSGNGAFINTFSGTGIGLNVQSNNASAIQSFAFGTGYGASLQSVGNIGAYISTTSGVSGAAVEVNPASTNSPQTILQLKRYTSGTAANGIAGRIEFITEPNTNTADVTSGYLESGWEDATFATRKSYMAFHTTLNGVTARKLNISSAGQITADQYTGTNFQTIDTSFNSLVVDASGNIFKRAGDNGSGTLIPTGNQYQFVNGIHTISRPDSIIDAREYGCVGDNSTDNTSAFQSMFDAIPGGSHIYIPPGKYKIFGTIIIRKGNITIEGSNGDLSYNYATAQYDSSGTLLIGTSSTANMIIDSASGIILEKLSFLNNTTPSAGTGVVLASAGHFFHINQCRFYGFYNNLEVENGALWNITDCDFWNPINRNLYIHSPLSPDSGDWAIIGCNFIGDATTVTHIRYESSGGGKIIGCKFNNLNGAAGTLIGTCIDLNNTHSTSDFIVSDCSFENFSGKAISLNSAADSFYNIQIHGNQFSTYSTVTNVIYATGKVGTISIRNNIFHDAGANTVYAVLLNGVGTTQIENNSWRGWTNKINPGTATTVGGNSRYTSATTDDALYYFGNSTAETFGIQNLNSSGFSGIDYIDYNGVPRVRTGWSNSNGQEFKIDNVVSGGYTTLYANGSEKIRINSTGVAIGAAYYLPPTSGTSGYVMTSQGGSSVTWSPIPSSTTLYTGDGTLSGNRTVTGSSNSLTFDGVFNYRINANSFLLSKTGGGLTYSTSVLGSNNLFQIGYTPTPTVYGKGAGLYIDTNNNAGLGVSVPTSAPLYTTGLSAYVQGFQSAGGNFYKITNVTSNITADLAGYCYIIDASGGNVTITLPAASTAFGGSVGIQYVFKRVDNSINTITVQRAGSDTIDGGTSFTLATQYSDKTIQCISTSAWAIIEQL